MVAYYNEWDKPAAQWLRELIKDGQLPAGDVDERSILDVTVDDIRGYDQCHFFAGIGGWPYAVRLAGWPDDKPVWTGSPPCQPFSAAGLGEGEADERHLWPAYFGLIQTFRPPIIFGEQVASKLVIGQVGKPKPSSKAGRGDAIPPEWSWLDAVFDDLEAAHYACGALVVPACGFGAFHKRDRLWFIARSLEDRWEMDHLGRLANCQRNRWRESGDDHRQYDGPKPTASGQSQLWPLGHGQRLEGRNRARSSCERTVGATGLVGGMADSDCERFDRKHTLLQQGQQESPYIETAGGGEVGNLADSESPRRRIRNPDDQRKANGEIHASRHHRQARTMANTSGVFDPLGHTQYERHDRVTQRGSFSAGEIEGRMLQSEGSGYWDAADWLPCKDGRHRPVEPSTFPLVDGISSRMVPSDDPCEAYAQSTGEARKERLKGYGNAIVPQLAAEFILASIDAGSLDIIYGR